MTARHSGRRARRLSPSKTTRRLINRPRRLAIEALEDRRLLSVSAGSDDEHDLLVSPGIVEGPVTLASTSALGEIHGTKWNDLDADGQRDASEPGLAGWTIFLDANQNGRLDSDETSTITAADGSYAFTGLEPGDYFVAEVTPLGWEQTSPGRSPVVTKCISAPADGTKAIGANRGPAVSADGRFVAFQSAVSNLVPDDTNGTDDVFVLDRQTNLIERVSVASSGAQGNAESFAPSISADGRFVVFISNADNLVPGDTNAAPDVFVYDRQTRVIERVSIGSDGTQANAQSFNPLVSDDGRYVAFSSDATNLYPQGSPANAAQVYVYDRQTDQLKIISLGLDGMPGNNHSDASSMSGDGRFVAFGSRASNLVNGDTNSCTDVFVYDRQTGTMERVSIGSDGGQANDISSHASISDDGRYVAFESWAGNLVAGDRNGDFDVFLRDRQTGSTELISRSAVGTPGSEFSHSPSISGDGRYVAFVSQAANLVPGDANHLEDVYVLDRQTGRMRRARLCRKTGLFLYGGSVHIDVSIPDTEVKDDETSPDG